jgi:hypothetical protein
MWKPVVGWEGFYEVSSLGEVRSVDRETIGPNGFPKRLRGQLMKLGLRGGYLCVHLKRPGQATHYPVHRLVGKAFNGLPPEGRNNCCHKDGQRFNNTPENLYWGTTAENGEDLARHGTRKGEGHPNSKLTAFQVFMIQEIPKRYRLINDLAKKFNVNPSCIKKARYGSSWDWV